MEDPRKGLISSSLFVFLRTFHGLQNAFVIPCDIGVALFAVGQNAVGAVLDASGEIPEITAAPVPQSIERTIAEEAVEVLRVRLFMAGEKLTVPVAEI